MLFVFRVNTHVINYLIIGVCTAALERICVCVCTIRACGGHDVAPLQQHLTAIIVLCVCVWEYARALWWLWRCESSSVWQQPAAPEGGRWLRELSQCRKTVNGKQSAELRKVLFFFTHAFYHFVYNVHILKKKHHLRLQCSRFTTHRDNIKINSVTAERETAGGMKCCVHKRALLSCCIIPAGRFLSHWTQWLIYLIPGICGNSSDSETNILSPSC